MKAISRLKTVLQLKINLQLKANWQKKLKNLTQVLLTRVLLTLSTSILSSGCAHSTAKHLPPTVNNLDDVALRRVIDQYTEAIKHLDPYSAPYFNIEADLSKFGDFPSPAFYDRAKAIYQTTKSDLRAVHFDQLSKANQLTYRLFAEDVDVSLKGFDFPSRYLDLNQMSSRLHDYIDSSSETLTNFPFDSVSHYDAYLKRSMEFPAYVDRQIAMLREGMRKKVVLSCTVAKKVPNSYNDALEKKTDANPFYRPVGFMPKNFSKEDRDRLSKAYADLVDKRILPGYIKFDQFFREEYLPHCRNGFGIKSLPGGDEWYRYAILANTNLSLDPAAVHKTGLDEVARISNELEKIKLTRHYKGSLQEFLKSEAINSKSFFTSSSDMFRAFEKVKLETALRIPKFFSLIPQSDFKIVETSNPEDAAGSYNQPTELMPYGRFIANTKNLRSVPISGVTTLMIHETVPGHHFQLALQFEMKDKLSEFQRKIYGSNSFVEGWALYAEFLGNEMGMFEDPTQKFGHLNEEMLRAVRLVVDTGIHNMGWSQKKAIKYMREHLASDIGDITNEANRYSVWPGQALGYKIGQLKILELRRQAERELGRDFDIKGFHEAVIGNGTVSLGVLETQVKDWIQKVKLIHK